MEFNLLIGGEAGQGLMSIENLLAETLSALKFHFFATKNYMSRIRGGHNFHMFRIADHLVNALDDTKWDMIIALDSETEKIHAKDLKENGFLLTFEQIKEIEKQAREVYHDPRAANSVLTGIIFSAIGVPINQIAPKNPADTESMASGFSFADRWGIQNRYAMKPAAPPEHFQFDGNQALALGAILGGCQFMAGYPMTPATSIMAYFSEAALDLPIHFEQGEDEISVINMAIGASYAGLRSMVATSGGGFALMQEAVSLIGMTETPVVIIVGQRPGPSTGLPTRTEQAELNFVLHSGHGEFPRILFAPGSIDEAIYMARKSFELADAFQIPVFILTDQYFADSIQITEDPIEPTISFRSYPSFGRDYLRYRLIPNGISPLTYPGLGEAFVKCDSDEHDESGAITEDLALRVKMVDKRLSKFDSVRKAALLPSFLGEKDAETILICWGSNKLIVKEAVDRLNQSGFRVGALHFRQVYPLTSAMIESYNLRGKKLIDIENNATGQFAKLLKRELDIKVDHHILKYSGECFTVSEICRKVTSIIQGSATG
jgi:2-oxoglutarate ferredoxin oxidoreductase subunit alpha